VASLEAIGQHQRAGYAVQQIVGRREHVPGDQLESRHVRLAVLQRRRRGRDRRRSGQHDDARPQRVVHRAPLACKNVYAAMSFSATTVNRRPSIYPSDVGTESAQTIITTADHGRYYWFIGINQRQNPLTTNAVAVRHDDVVGVQKYVRSETARASMRNSRVDDLYLRRCRTRIGKARKRNAHRTDRHRRLIVIIALVLRLRYFIALEKR